MDEEYKAKEGFDSGFSIEEITLALQRVLYDDCIMVLQHKQLLEDENYAKGLQETYDAELAQQAIGLSVIDSDDEDIVNFEPCYPAASLELIGNHSPNWLLFSSSLSTSQSSSVNTASDSDDDLPTFGACASSQLLDLLPTKSYSASAILELTSDNKACLICLLDWKTSDCIKSLPCFHDFHSDCIDKWLMIKVTCPVCRHKITIEDQ